MATIRTRYDASSGEFTLQNGQDFGSFDVDSDLLDDLSDMDLDSLSLLDCEDGISEPEGE